MTTTSLQKRNAYLVIGASGLLLAAGYLGMSFQLPFGQLDQPGAAVFPIIVGATLIVASLMTLWEGWQMDRAEQVEFPAGTDRKRLFGLLALLLAYFLALPWVGQFIGSTLFCILLMRVLSDLGWARIVAYSLALAIALHVAFVILLKVPMPRSPLHFI
ncbi:MAG: tripartite tricarboxylate transporter TctB family protein [Betaproteobacteria bacterium]|nr:tripartite tricarboxylate transporter TctB family protein [Betaproteobacteria bacterium]